GGGVGGVGRCERGRRIANARADRQKLEPEALAVHEPRRRRRAVDLQDEPRPRSHRVAAFGGRPAERDALSTGSLAFGSLTGVATSRSRSRSWRRSKATFTAPRPPAPAACSRASR